MPFPVFDDTAASWNRSGPLSRGVRAEKGDLFTLLNSSGKLKGKEHIPLFGRDRFEASLFTDSRTKQVVRPYDPNVV